MTEQLGGARRSIRTHLMIGMALVIVLTGASGGRGPAVAISRAPILAGAAVG